MLSNLGSLAVLAATKKSSGSPLATILPLLLIVLVGYLLLVRPARARQRKALESRAAIEPGAEVTTTAGLLATVVAVDDNDVVTLEIAPGVHSRFVKGAIARVHQPFEEADETVDEPAEDKGPALEQIPAEDPSPPTTTPVSTETGATEPAPWEKRDQDPNDH